MTERDGGELVRRLLDATPPPTTGAGVDELLAAFAAIDDQRAAILALSAASLPAPVTLSDNDRPLLVELERRQKIWQDALAEALHRVGEQRCGATQLRAYADSP